jgi:hypothetical protein
VIAPATTALTLAIIVITLATTLIALAITPHRTVSRRLRDH